MQWCSISAQPAEHTTEQNELTSTHEHECKLKRRVWSMRKVIKSACQVTHTHAHTHTHTHTACQPTFLSHTSCNDTGLRSSMERT